MTQVKCLLASALVLPILMYNCGLSLTGSMDAPTVTVVTAFPLGGPGSTNLADANSTHTVQTTLIVRASEQSTQRISKYITGKFAEHLFFNVTNGMDAQILLNATLADYPFWTGGTSPDGVATFHFNRDQIAQEIRRQAPRWGWPESEIDGLVRSYNDGLACWWTKEGKIETSPDVGPHGGRAQRVHAQAAGQGIAQWTYLPLHRVRKYEFQIVARSPDVSTLTVGLDAPDGTNCERTTVSGLTAKWGTLKGALGVPADLPNDKAYRFVVTADSPGQFVVDSVFLWPADHVGRADPDVIRLLKQSQLPILRWPGGNFVSGYHWQDGVGPLEKRPTIPNYAWGQVENNLFGTDEFVAFCQAVGCEPMICVNAGSGAPDEAAKWIEYCNGSITTPMGALRAANGHPEPYKVRHWEVGNEIWGRWQYYWTTAEGYADRYRQFAQAMLKADPNIKLYACGAPVMWGKQWNDTLIGKTADILVRTTDHPLIGGQVSPEAEPLDVFRDFMAVPVVLEQKWAALQDDMKKAGINDPRLAVTELQMFARLGEIVKPDAPRRLRRDNLVAPATHAEALYDILIYHAAVRLSPFVEMVTHSATVNHGGGLRKSRERVFANPCHYAQAMFAQFANAVPVKIELNAPVQQAPLVLPELKNATQSCSYKIVDALAALAGDDILLVSIAHRGTVRPIEMTITLDGFNASEQANVQMLSADLPWVENTLENPELIVPVASHLAVVNNTLSLKIPPYSFCVLRIPRSPKSTIRR